MIQNIVNDDQFIVVTTQGRKKIVDPSVPTVMKDAKELNDAEMEEAEKPKYQVGKEDEATKKILLLFPKRLKQLLIIVPLSKTLKYMSWYAKLMKDLVTKKRTLRFEEDNKFQYCCTFATRSLVQIKRIWELLPFQVQVVQYILLKPYVSWK